MAENDCQGEDAIGIEPCPHCGPMPAHPEVIQDHLGYWRVVCGPCGSSSGTLPEGERWPDARQRVIDNWNRRHCPAPEAIPAAISNLIAGLRELAVLAHKGHATRAAVEGLTHENRLEWCAADAIETLLGRILSLSQERDRLREALAPFAEAFDSYSLSLGYAVQRRAVKAEDCRRARAALNKEPPCQET